MTKITWTDDDVRTALAVRNRGGSMADAGAAIGRTKSAVCGFFNRCDIEARAITDECTKPENKDEGGWSWA